MIMPILANDVTKVYMSDSEGDCCFCPISLRGEYATCAVLLHFCIQRRSIRTNDNTELKKKKKKKRTFVTLF
jgi:aerobic-type carbon monoxide dehydrogenase small subunit (CoxS/CutS family)